MMRLGKGKQLKILTFFLLLSASGTAVGQPGKILKYRLSDDAQPLSVRNNEGSLVINYSLSEAGIEAVFNEHGAFYRITIPEHSSTKETGKPELPVFSRLINIPENFSYRVRISEVRSTRIKPSSDNISGVLFPAQESETKIPQQKKPFVIDKAVYKKRGFLLSDTVSIRPVGKLRNFNLANLAISPARYNPGTNLLEIITSMRIEIIFDGQQNFTSKSLYPESQLFIEPLSKSLLNFDNSDLITGYSDKPVRMLIVTDTSFLKDLQPLIRWKTQKGYRVEVLTMGANSAGTTYTQVKNTLTGIYNESTESNPPPEFLLIVGDVSKVPPYNEGTSSVTDMYYGEFTGNGDYIPEMYVGRIPVSKKSQLKSVVKKIIQYEKVEFADTNKFYSRALATAGYDDNHANYMNGQVRYAVENYLNPANKITAKYFYDNNYLTGNEFLNARLAARKDSIINIINKGTGFITYSGHGDDYGWLNLSINTGDSLKFINTNMYPFIISNACRTARFTLNNSFGNWNVVAADKGAIGFIGCSRDSYWDEDYYWSVGLGSISAFPTYATTGLGAYDRLFHTHNELPSQWFTAMGQIMYAGNLAVSASTSSYKKYYWESYNLVGDPSIIPVIGTPSGFSFSLPDTLPNGMTSLSLAVEPFAYVAVSHSDTLWDASFANQQGSVILTMPGLANDSCLIVVTAQNRIPLIKTVYFSEVSSKFLNIKATSVNDSAGNNDSRADYGETFYLAFTLSNLGLSDANEVSAKLSTTSQWVTMNNDSVNIGTLTAGSDIIVSDGFNLTLSELVPDEKIISFDLLVKDQLSEIKYSFDISAHAPNLEIISMKIDDSSGNHNFIADPGEAPYLIFTVRNFGSSNTSGDFTVLTSDGDKLDITSENIKSGILKFNEISEIVVPSKLSEDTEIGSIITLSASLSCFPYAVNKDFSFRVGKLRENFESSSFKIYPWINFSSAPWTITSTNAYEGAVSARSGVIPNNGTSSLKMRTIYSSPDSVRFYYKVSSEKDYDFFSFRLNGSEIFKESGETGWKKKAIAVPAGPNDLEWLYRKDSNTDGGADAAWIDLVDFSVSGSLRYIERDLKVAKIITPFQSENLGKEKVSVKVVNVGHDTIYGFNLSYLNNNRLPVKQFFQNTVYPYKDSVTVTFNAPTDMSRYGIYNLSVYSMGNNEDYLLNDTLRLTLENTVIDEPLLVFPNPFTDHLNVVINTNNTDTVTVTLASLKGVKLYESEEKLIAGENTLIINSEIARLQPGLYYLTIRGRIIKKSVPVIKLRQ